MFQKLVLAGVLLTLAVLTGCGEGQILGPDTEVVRIVVASRVEHPHVVTINGIEQDLLLVPSDLSNEYLFEARVSRRQYRTYNGVQYQREFVNTIVSLYDLETQLQSRGKEKEVEVGVVEYFEFTESDFR